MSTPTTSRFTSTLAKELYAGFSGIFLVLFIVVHLSGNLLIYAGPEAFNGYSEKLHNLGELLWVLRAGLIFLFATHILSALSLARDNLGRRGQRYQMHTYMSDRALGTRTMAISGLLIFFFIWLHLYDFTWSDKTGPKGVIAWMGEENLGLYGVVFNAFGNPLHALFYIVVMCGLGLHLSHAISSVCVTLGAQDAKFLERADLAARVAGAALALGFSSIPLYVLVRTHLIG